MKTNEIICDCCGRTYRPSSRWEENTNGGVMTIVPDGINGAYKFEDLCPTCRGRLYKAFAAEFVLIKRESANEKAQ